MRIYRFLWEKHFMPHTPPFTGTFPRYAYIARHTF